MTEISRSALFGKLDSLAFKAIDNATVFCKMRGNPMSNWCTGSSQILQLQDSDLHRIISHFELDLSRLAKDITIALDRLPRGSTSTLDLSSHVEEAVERGWLYGTLMFNESKVRTGHIADWDSENTRVELRAEELSAEFSKISPDTLTGQLHSIVGGSPEEHLAASDGTQLGGAAPTTAEGEMPAAPLGEQQALRQFSQ